MRSVSEWRGKTDDSPIPDRVRIRLFTRGQGRCAVCTRLIYVGVSWHCDHIIALVNGGSHSEDNLQVVCEACHKTKSKADVAEKSKTYQSRKRHLGLKKSRHPLPGSRNTPWKRKMDGTVVKR